MFSCRKSLFVKVYLYQQTIKPLAINYQQELYYYQPILQKGELCHGLYNKERKQIPESI